MIDYNIILTKLNQTLTIIRELTSVEFISNQEVTDVDKNAKKSIKLGKKADEYICQLVRSKEGIEKYRYWLSSTIDYQRWNAAFNMYPLFPKECFKILLECEKKCNEELEKSDMNVVINLYSKSFDNDNILYRRLKKIYNVDDLSLISRERL
ncbi:hypothetical protein BN85412690 [Alteracholeplasma palmae J233]|uniref:Uncharacterized protein n=1 Tax=Alteracholeplasma palmae (strain ATCC 49389 / J233) TaxID=1318466 RepID=U4KS93_ALTPJ|nr:hypothetical protein [Alteracholeplasma palmae]CCV64846.1 hypothetical protein BN85412690 [Alteracholeplasma palmae J233]